jgi:hypothetical protein
LHPISVITHRWQGLCRKPPVAHALQSGTGHLPEPALENRPDGGAGGSGATRRTVSALTGLKTLIRNPQLLWFSLLVGLALAGLSIIQGSFSAVFSSPGWQFFSDSPISHWRFFTDPFITQLWPAFYPDNARLLSSLVQTFVQTMVAELVTVFCLVFLLAGLVLSLSSKKGGTVSFFHGLAMAQKNSGPLARWSVAVALAGTLLFTFWQYSYVLNLTIPSGYLDHALTRNPFNYVLSPNLLATIFPGGMFGFYFEPIYSVLTDTLILSAINVFLFALTLFVVPLLVLEHKSLTEAVSGSFALMRTCWREVAACVLGLGIVVFSALLASLLFPMAAGGNIAVDYWPPPYGWLVAGTLYVLALSGLAFVVATIGGIATLDIYTSAKSRQIAGYPEPEPCS